MKKIFFDFDETIYKTSKSIIKYFKKRGIELKEGYNEDNCLSDLSKSFGIKEEEIREMFSSDELYKFDIDMFYDYSLELIEQLLEDGHYVSIVTVGEKINNENKKILMEKLIPGLDFQCKNFEFFKGMSKEEMYDKSIFDMKDGFHIDDNEICLKTSNAKVKILFRKESESFKTLNSHCQFSELINNGGN